MKSTVGADRETLKTDYMMKTKRLAAALERLS